LASPKSVILGVPLEVSRTFAGFQVAMNDAALVRGLHGIRQRGKQRCRLCEGSGVPANFWDKLPLSTKSIVKYADRPIATS